MGIYDKILNKISFDPTNDKVVEIDENNPKHSGNYLEQISNKNEQALNSLEDSNDVPFLESLNLFSESIDNNQDGIPDVITNFPYNLKRKAYQTGSSIASAILPTLDVKGGPIDDFAYNILSLGWEKNRSWEDVSNQWLIYSSGETPSHIITDSHYKGFTPIMTHQASSNFDFAGYTEENQRFTKNGRDVDILSIYLQRSENILEPSQYHPSDDFDVKSLHKIHKDLSMHPSLEHNKGNITYYSIDEFSEFGGFKPHMRDEDFVNTIIEGSGNYLAFANNSEEVFEDMSYADFQNYLLNESDKLFIDPSIKLSQKEQWLKEKEINHKSKIIELGENLANYHRSLFLLDEHKTGDRYNNTRANLVKLLQTGEPLIIGSENIAGDSLYGNLNSESHITDADIPKQSIALYNTSVDIGGFTQILSKDENGYYFAIYDSYDFDPTGSGAFQDSKEVNNFYDMGVHIVNTIGKPIPIYDRYYLEEGELDGLLEFYSLSSDGSEIAPKEEPTNSINNSGGFDINKDDEMINEVLKGY
tara:strand:- start:24457 stop:26049 length:1593 start_codon:yes stop_codon:yes gene_type:complete